MDMPVFAEKARSALGLAVALAAGIMVVTSLRGPVDMLLKMINGKKVNSKKQ